MIYSFLGSERYCHVFFLIYLGVTWEEHGRNVFVSPSLVLCFPIVSKRSLTSSFSPHSLIFRTVLVSPSLRLCFSIDAKAKVYRCQSEGKAKFYRTSIEHLSKTYRTSIEDLSKMGEEGAEREQRKKSSRKRDFHPPLSRNRA